MIDIEPLRTFIRREFLFDRNADLPDDLELFPSVLDSLGVMELVEFVEETYAVELNQPDLAADNFRSITAIAELIQRKTA